MGLLLFLLLLLLFLGVVPVLWSLVSRAPVGQNFDFSVSGSYPKSVSRLIYTLPIRSFHVALSQQSKFHESIQYINLQPACSRSLFYPLSNLYTILIILHVPDFFYFNEQFRLHGYSTVCRNSP